MFSVARLSFIFCVLTIVTAGNEINYDWRASAFPPPSPLHPAVYSREELEAVDLFLVVLLRMATFSLALALALPLAIPLVWTLAQLTVEDLLGLV